MAIAELQFDSIVWRTSGATGEEILGAGKLYIDDATTRNVGGMECVRAGKPKDEEYASFFFVFFFCFGADGHSS